MDRYGDEVAEQMMSLTHWWIRRMVATDQPASEKLTFLWHNHFATSAKKVRLAGLMAAQNQKLRELALGDFGSLAYAMLTDAAMIKWLDGQQNKSGSPNENLSREFMELFALGHGNGYTENDVREGARALTGWRVEDDHEARLNLERHDDRVKSILGTTGRIGAKKFCELVIGQGDSARFVTSRWWQQVATNAPPSEEVSRRLIAAYGPARDLGALTAAILTHPEFLTGESNVIASPVDWVVGLIRALEVDIKPAKQVNAVVAALTSLAQLPFYPPDVGGWPAGRGWLSTSTVVTRFRIARKMAERGNISLVEEAATTDRIDAAGYLMGIGVWSDRSVAALTPLRDDPVALIVGVANTPEYLTS